MKDQFKVSVIIPALNEEASIGRVVETIPDFVDEVIVVDNGSTDATARVAAVAGAKVVREPIPGYGRACLSGIKAVKDADIIVFLDGDFSDDASEMDTLVDPIISDGMDLVIGSRMLGSRQPGALTIQARMGNWLACRLMHWIWKVRYTDLGPFRAIRATALQELAMRDPDFGWTVEMQIKAARQKLKVREVPVSYRKRIGQSKISGTLKGVFFAGTKILYTIAVCAWEDRRGTWRLPRKQVPSGLL